jgi:hypothetical protein
MVEYCSAVLSRRQMQRNRGDLDSKGISLWLIVQSSVEESWDWRQLLP